MCFKLSTIEMALNFAQQALRCVAKDRARFEARLLLCHVTSFEQSFTIGHPQQTLDKKTQKKFLEAIERRQKYEPIAKIIGKKEFWGLNFIVTTDTLDPRPDSEILIETALSLPKDFERPTPQRILDLGTGSGCLLLSLLHQYPQAIGVGTDICPSTLRIAIKNAIFLGIEKKVLFIQSSSRNSWFLDEKEPFDLVISNPPYILTADILKLSPSVKNFDPINALDGGSDGLDCYRAISKSLSRMIKPKGFAVFEVGQNMAHSVTEILEVHGMCLVRKVKDLNSITRCLVFQKQQ